MFHLFAQAREVLHVSFAALDFLIENHAIEAFAALEELPGKFQMRARDKAKATDVLLDHPFGFLNSFGYFNFLFPSQQGDLTHLLEIHPHRIVENINLRFRSLIFFVLVCVFFAILIAIHFRRLDNVDLQAAQPRQDHIQFVGVGDTLWQRLV